MSTARKAPNGPNFGSNVVAPIKIDLNFVVDSTNGNGLGVRSIKSNGWVQNVFMHTSATPGTGNGGQVNPNPAAGFCLIQLKNNFNVYLGGFSGFVSQIGTPATTVTQHDAYIITSLGTASLAQWQAVGVPQGLTPSVGMSFIATSTGTIGGSATAAPPSVSGITCVEVVGDPNQSINNASIAQNGGAYLLVQFLGATSSSSTTLVPTAPANNAVCGLSMFFDQSSVTVDGL
jgi:hypothetical protein